MTTVERGFLGTMPLGTERDDDSYLDFTEGVRVFNTQIAQAMQARGKQAIAEYEARTGRKISSVEEANAALKGVPVVDTLARMRRSS
ncbi:MAG: hypothetical protein NZ518_10885, partial [Dehalococcoidia bacterium]|nr:hypothetical protein [Dehalococcoidia bacterium]